MKKYPSHTEGSVLIVEDEEFLLESLSTILTDVGYHTITAKSPVEAIPFLEEYIFDTILSDLIMPKMDGLEFLRVVREKGIQVPFLVLTGNGESEKVLEALRLGAWDFISKPCESYELKKILLRSVDTGRRIRNIQERLDLPTEEHTPELAKQIERDKKFINLNTLLNNSQRAKK